MVYLVQGNAQQIFKLFGAEWVIRKGDNNPDTIDSELSLAPFIGTEEQAVEFTKIWKTQSQNAYYTQGNITAGNLYILLGAPFQPFLKPNEGSDDYKKQFVLQDFAYLNNEQEPCGIMLISRKDNPSQWMLGLIKNNHLAPEERTVVLLSSFDLTPYMTAANEDIKGSSVDALDNPFFRQIDAPFIKNRLEKLIQADSEINLCDPAIEKLSRLLNMNKPQGLYLEPSLVCEFALKYNLLVSQNTIAQLNHNEFALEQEFKKVTITDEERFNKNLLQMLVLFYEDETLEQNRDLIDDHEFIKAMGALMWDPAQIRLMPLLVSKKYSLDLMQLILSQEAYYRCYNLLVQLDLTEEVPAFFTNSDKLSQLAYINGLADEQCRKLCLIFWVKGKLSLDELKEIVKATEEYPMLAETLVALDQEESIISIKDLRKHALNPLIHMQKSILHRDLALFEAYNLKKSDLTKLTLDELDELSRSFNVLKQTAVTSPDAYRLALMKNNQGQLLRIFLPELAEVSDLQQRTELINLLYKGVEKGVVSQGKALFEIKDRELAAMALELHKRFICTKQMQDLNFTKEVIAFASKKDSLDATRFRHVIFKVEEQCKEIHERLRKSSSDGDKVSKWQPADEQYRRSLYSIAYEGITQSTVDLSFKINQAEAIVLNIVDPEMKSWLEKILVVIANILITSLSFGFANDIKERETGNYWFFNQTTSGEKIRVLDKEVKALIDCPDADIIQLSPL